jgi:hypothetical protein
MIASIFFMTPRALHVSLVAARVVCPDGQRVSTPHANYSGEIIGCEYRILSGHKKPFASPEVNLVLKKVAACPEDKQFLTHAA